MLKFVLPKGSLEKATFDLFEAADLSVVRSSSVDYKATIDDPRIDEVRILRPQEIGMYVQEGLFDLGITGRDWIEETSSDVVSLGQLQYSKATSQPVRVIVAVADSSPAQTVADLKDQADAARFAAARLDREAKREKYVAQFSDRLTADSKTAVEALFDAVYTLAPVKFGEGTKPALEVLTSIVTAIQPHKLDKQVASAPVKFGEEQISAHDARERELEKIFDQARVEFREGKAGNAPTVQAHFEYLVRESNLAKKGN